MKEPENMISTKDLLYVSDVLNVTITLAKKMRVFENTASDQKVTNEVKAVKELLKKQFNTLMEVLED